MSVKNGWWNKKWLSVFVNGTKIGLQNQLKEPKYLSCLVISEKTNQTRNVKLQEVEKVQPSEGVMSKMAEVAYI